MTEWTCGVFPLTQLHLAISKTSAKVVIDCKMVAEKSINAAGNITTDGLEVLGRMVRSRGNKDNSAPVRDARTHTYHYISIIIYIHTRHQVQHNHTFPQSDQYTVTKKEERLNSTIMSQLVKIQSEHVYHVTLKWVFDQTKMLLLLIGFWLDHTDRL